MLGDYCCFAEREREREREREYIMIMAVLQTNLVETRRYVFFALQ